MLQDIFLMTFQIIYRRLSCIEKCDCKILATAVPLARHIDIQNNCLRLGVIPCLPADYFAHISQSTPQLVNSMGIKERFDCAALQSAVVSL